MLQAASASATSAKAAKRVAARAQLSTLSILVENTQPLAAYKSPSRQGNRPPFRPECGSRNRLWGLRPVRAEGRGQAGGNLGVADDGPRHLPVHPGPGACIRHQRAQQRMVELVAAAYGAVGAEQGSARECQVADGVQYLVANKLVGEPRTFRVENTVVADHERIFQRGAQRVAGVP